SDSLLTSGPMDEVFGSDRATLADIAAIERRLHELGVPPRFIKLHLERVARWRRAHRKRVRLSKDEEVVSGQDGRPRIRNRPRADPPRPGGGPPKTRRKSGRGGLAREPGEAAPRI